VWRCGAGEKINFVLWCANPLITDSEIIYKLEKDSRPHNVYITI